MIRSTEVRSAANEHKKPGIYRRGFIALHLLVRCRFMASEQTLKLCMLRNMCVFGRRR